jgi:hypothetical protein
MLSSMPHASFRLARLALLYALCPMLYAIFLLGPTTRSEKHQQYKFGL